MVSQLIMILRTACGCTKVIEKEYQYGPPPMEWKMPLYDARTVAKWLTDENALSFDIALTPKTRVFRLATRQEAKGKWLSGTNHRVFWYDEILE